MEELSNSDRTEEIIKRVILKIRKSRSRPCYQNILNLVNRGGEFHLEMDELKKIINEMVKKNIIVDKGKNGNESLYITSEIITDADLTDNEDDDIESLSEIESFINEKFNHVLLNKIKSEIVSALSDKSFLDNVKRINSGDNDNTPNSLKDANPIITSNNDLLIEVLKDEINFLRNELASKNKIIELIIKDKYSLTPESQQASKTVSSVNSTNKKRLNHKNINTTSNHRVLLNNNNALEDETYFSTDEDDVHTVGTKAKLTDNIKRNITIIGDSIIKDMKSYKMKQGLSSQDRVYIKSFPGAKIECMTDYVKPSMKYNPDVLLLHCGTNDLRSSKDAMDVANDIIALANNLKKDDNEVIISGLFERKDKWNEKGKEVNIALKLNCAEKKYLFCDNSNLSSNFHINTNGLHLNENGTIALANNFLACLNL